MARLRMWLVMVGGAVFLFFFIPFAADAAILSLTPERTRIAPYETARVKVILDTEGEIVNVLGFTVELGEGATVVAVETGNSVVSLWADGPTWDPRARRVTGAGGIPGGFQGIAEVVTLVVAPAETRRTDVPPGSLTLTIGPSEVFLADGAGTLAPLIREGTQIEVVEGAPLALESDTHPDQNQWYRERNFRLAWEARPGARYSLLLDDVADTAPDPNAPAVNPPLEFPNLPDGVHYAHVREGVRREDDPSNYTWSETAHFRFLIDGTPPEEFMPLLDRKTRTIAFTATDKGSGIDRYERTFLGGFRSTESPAKLGLITRIFGGDLAIRAIDRAGNSREATIAIPVREAPRTVGALVLVVVLYLIGSRIIKARFKMLSK